MAEPEPPPAVVASHVDIVYRVFGAGRARRVEEGNALARLLDRSRSSVGIREVHAVKDVSFVARRGESIGIIGRNGSGKSTLLRSVAGLIPPTSGAIYLGGRAALLGVNAVLMRSLSGARNVMIGGQALGLTKAEVQARFDDIVEFADIGEFIQLPMSSYSSGMAARLRFAISTAAVPDILVVDEALSTGDAQFKAKASERIEQIRQAAGTVFMVSHSSATITAMCSRALWMDDGHLIMDGPSAEVVAAYAERYPGKKPAAKKPAAKKSAAKPAAAKPPPAKEPQEPVAQATGKPAVSEPAEAAAEQPGKPAKGQPEEATAGSRRPADPGRS